MTGVAPKRLRTMRTMTMMTTGMTTYQHARKVAIVLVCLQATSLLLARAPVRTGSISASPQWLASATLQREQSTTKNAPSKISSANNFTCEMFSFMPFTTVDATTNEKVANLPFSNDLRHDNPGYNQLIAAVMALEEFNSKSTALVPDLALMHDCPIQLGFDEKSFLDSGTVGHLASQGLFNTGRPPCAIAGPYHDDPALELQTLATAAQFPHVVSRAYNTKVASVDDGPYTTSLFPDLFASMDVVTSFLRNFNRTDFVSLIHSLSELGIQRREALGLALDQDGLPPVQTDKVTKEGQAPNEQKRTKVSWNSFGYDIGVKTREIRNAMRQVRESGYRTIIVAMDNPSSGEMKQLADAAQDLGMNNRDAVAKGDTDYLWIFWGKFDAEYIYTDDENIAQLLAGSVWFLPGVVGHTGFLQAWTSMAGDVVKARELLDRVDALSPIQDPSQPGYFRGKDDYFLNNVPEAGSDLLFDAIMSIGIGGCLAYYDELDGRKQYDARREEFVPYYLDHLANSTFISELPTLDDYKAALSQDFFTPLQVPEGAFKITGQKHNNMIRRLEFFGASGHVQFQKPEAGAATNNTTKNDDEKVEITVDEDGLIVESKAVRRKQEIRNYARDQSNFVWFVINNLPSTKFLSDYYDVDVYLGDEGNYTSSSEDSSEDSGSGPDTPMLFMPTHLFFPETETMPMTWVEMGQIIYADGTTSGPKLLRTTPEQNYLEPALQILGFVVMSTIMASAVFCAVWVYMHQKDRVLRASQPLFLYLLFLGSAIVASGILSISFDESFGWGTGSLSTMCTLMPWLLSTGFIIMYGAMFAKLWRVNRVLSFTRRKIDVRHVAWPVALLIFAAFAILTTWTIVDPLQWQRTVVDQATGESIGSCGCVHRKRFGIPLMIVNITPVFLTGIMSWKTKDVDNAYSEAYWIFVLIFTHMEIILVSVPVFVVLEGQSTNGQHLGFVSMISVISGSTLLLVMLPKFIAYYWNDERSTTLRGSVGGGQIHVTGMNAGGTGRHRNSNVSALSYAYGSQLSQHHVDRLSVMTDTSNAKHQEKAPVLDVEKCSSQPGTNTSSSTVSPTDPGNEVRAPSPTMEQQQEQQQPQHPSPSNSPCISRVDYAGTVSDFEQ